MKTSITRLLIAFALVTPFYLHAQWQSLDSGTEVDLQDIFFLNENYGVTVGGQGTALLTTNGGNTWTSISGDLAEDLHSVVIWNVDTILVGAGNIFESALYLTTNGGSSWEEVEDASELALAGDRIHGLRYDALIYSDDAGAGWTDSGVDIGGTTLLEQLVFADAHYGQAIGNIAGFATYSTYALMTDDGGATWQPWFVFDLPNGDAWTAAAYPDPDTLFLFSNQFNGFLPGTINKVVRLTDFYYDDTPGFDGWRFSSEVVNDSMPTYINAGHFLNGSTGFAAGADGNIYRTDDGGVSWAADHTGTDSLFAVFFGDPEVGYVVGQAGAILRNEGPSGIGYPNIEPLKLFPNPTGSSVWVQGLETPAGLLRIYDVSGQLVKSEKWRVGQEIDLQQLPGGLYSLRLQTDQQVFSGKVVKH